MVARKLRVAAEAVTSAGGGFMEKKGTERRLLLAMKNDGQIFVVETKNQSVFSLQKRERAAAKAQSILSGGGEGPWPLFCSQMNVIPPPNKFRCGSFVKERVSYEVLLIADCGVLGQKQGATALEALDTHGFKLVPIKAHPFGAYVRRVLQLG